MPLMSLYAYGIRWAVTYRHTYLGIFLPDHYIHHNETETVVPSLDQFAERESVTQHIKTLVATWMTTDLYSRSLTSGTLVNRAL